MAKKIDFNVVFVTDEDSSFPSCELNHHDPTIHGWRSSTNSKIAPHDIIIRFQKPAYICRIQVLAHQYLIPQKIELWLHFSSNEMPSTPSSQCFDFLGFILLSDNSSSNYSSRELQSITVAPRKGTHLKLRLSNAHPNHLNTHNQIALIAINVLGEYLKDENFQMTDFPTSETGEIILDSICDDLLFSMYVEEGTREIIRKLELQKINAINSERFEYARKLKLCMTALRTVGERLGRYALAKKQAVMEEDFTTAKLRKEQIELYRSDIITHLRVHDLLEKDGVLLPQNDLSSELYAAKPTLPPPPSLQHIATIMGEGQFKKSTLSPKNSDSHLSVNLRKSQDEISNKRSPNCDSPMSSRGSSLRRRNKSTPRSIYDDYEERAIPTLSHSETHQFLRECHGTVFLENEGLRGRSRLNDREKRQAALPIFVFGIELVEQFYSRQFQDREDGLTRLQHFLTDNERKGISSNNKIARSAAFLLHRAVRDAVYSVFSQATEAVRVLFLEFVPGRVSVSEVARCVDRLLPELLAKSGDPSARIHTLAQHTILSIAACSEVKEQHLVAPALSRTVGTGTHPRLALSRMQMLEQICLSQGICSDKASGLTCRILSECGCSGIHHPAESVRKVAERILLLVYKVNPRMVRKQLPPDDDITRRNLLYRQLFTEFDKLDLERKCEILKINDIGTSLDGVPPLFYRNDKKASINSNDNKTVTYNAQSSTDSSNVKVRINYKVLNEESNAFSSKNHAGSLKTKNLNLDTTIKSSNPEAREDLSTLHCTFCDWNCHGEPSQLDKHYWKFCPYLTKCSQCSQILEIPALTFHLINECETKSNYMTCDRCKESVNKKLIQFHLMEDYCQEIGHDAVKCPLCHEVIVLAVDGGWKNHLLSTPGCSGNSRKLKNGKTL